MDIGFGSARKSTAIAAALLVAACAQVPDLSRSKAGYNISAPPSRSGETIILGKDDVIRVSDLSPVEYQQHLTVLTRAFEREAPFTVYFRFGAAGLDPSAKDSLDMQAAWIRAHPQALVSVTGHTDKVGDPGYNHALGMTRAREVVAYLVQQGIDRSRLIALESAGEKELTTAIDQGFLSNRRVVTSVIEIAEPRNNGSDGEFAGLVDLGSAAASSGGPVGSGGGGTGAGGSTGGGSTGGGSTGGGSTGGGGTTGGGSTGGGSTGGGSGGSSGPACGPKDC